MRTLVPFPACAGKARREVVEQADERDGCRRRGLPYDALRMSRDESRHFTLEAGVASADDEDLFAGRMPLDDVIEADASILILSSHDSVWKIFGADQHPARPAG